MRNFLFAILMSIMTFGFTSCVSSQTLYADYQKVYFDHVVYGHVYSTDYVWDGTYSYHILGNIPLNVYWELYPCGWEVYVYNTNMVRLRLYDYTRRSIYYNRTHHNYYRFDDRHRPPMKPNIDYHRNHNTYNQHRPYNHRPDYMPNQHRPDYRNNQKNNTRPSVGGNSYPQRNGHFGGAEQHRGGRR